ncbi:hypothetical protein ACQPYK_17925 [Streptosporangium sp. CA-135522]|uniref:hypothetical protein n=1 Tax=Streptosporangium sp. CA-135522 TaxID=3240072 RepID=UPI003D9292FD
MKDIPHKNSNVVRCEKMYQENYLRVVDNEINPSAPAVSMIGGGSKIEVYKGFRKVTGATIDVIGSGAWVEGTLTGDLTTYAHEEIYKIYNLKENESADYWFIKYQKEKDHDELKKAFEETTTQSYHFDFKYRLQGNDYGITAVDLGFVTIRIDYEGMTKLFTVPNSASSRAKTNDGEDYPGGFEPI